MPHCFVSCTHLSFHLKAISMSLLKAINSPVDVKALEPNQLSELAQELRERIIETTAIQGGHIGPNLGVVELTIALHRVFDTLKDRITFDVSHQGYAHKLLTGRNNAQFDQLRQSEGYCGFLARSESPHDAFGAGHAALLYQLHSEWQQLAI